MLRASRLRAALLPALALGLAAMLGGCVVYPAGYGYRQPGYYSAPVVGYGGWGGGGHHHRHDW